METSIQKSFIHAECRTAENVSTNGQQTRLDDREIALRPDVVAIICAQQRVLVQLAVRGQWPAFKPREADRDHVVWQTCRQESP
jgi:hypothetical protein